MSVHREQMTLDELAGESPVVRFLTRYMRDGAGMSLHAAIRQAEELSLDPADLSTAVQRIEKLNKEIQTAQVPRSVVAGNIESWYSGPRSEDRNWSALVDLLRDDRWNDDSIDSLDEASTKVVANLPNPHGAEDFHCRGLVLGYVQSGKTTNFTAVIAKAADAGYRMVIILSGIHDALRRQTQDRLNEQLWQPNADLWHRLTNESDFRETDNVDALLANSTQRVLIVVKKNASRLRALAEWLDGAQPKLLAACPILIIDDEADQASVNTARSGRVTKINRLIRTIVNESPRAAYVGYTATPFANILIDAEDFDDLYPRDFIVDLPRPRAYIGPEAIFGREPLEFDAEEVHDGSDLIRSVPIDELDELRPKGAAARQTFHFEITPSLDGALRYFLLSTAARRVRRQGNLHCTALVHTSQHVDVHEETARAIRHRINTLAARVSGGDESLLDVLASQWELEQQRVPSSEFDLEPVDWADIAAILPSVVTSITVVTDNSRTPPDERLNFDDSHPGVIIAVGGNTLSRGLTLEGLAVSFFVRSASAYDTLLQMGRWFGYRNGYADLTRIWMTDEMREWFHHLSTVEEEIRFDIESMETQHVKPDELGPRIRTHPKLAITAASKMQHARAADASYSGRRLQTILFNHLDAEWVTENLRAARALLTDCAALPRTEIRPGIDVIGPIESVRILDFLGVYRFHENSRDLNSDLIRNYIEKRLRDHELTHFKVAVMARSPKSQSDYLGSVDLGLGTMTGCINRARIDAVGGSTYADIKALMSSTDRVIDLPLSREDFADVQKAGDLARVRDLPGRGGRGDGTGLLLVYPISKASKPLRGSLQTRTALNAADHLIGVGIVFPTTESRSASVDYVTANVARLSSDVEEPDETDLEEETSGSESP